MAPRHPEASALGAAADEDAAHGDQDGYVGPDGRPQPHQRPSEVPDGPDVGLDARETAERDLLDEL